MDPVSFYRCSANERRNIMRRASRAALDQPQPAQEPSRMLAGMLATKACSASSGARPVAAGAA